MTSWNLSLTHGHFSSDNIIVLSTRECAGTVSLLMNNDRNSKNCQTVLSLLTILFDSSNLALALRRRQTSNKSILPLQMDYISRLLWTISRSRNSLLLIFIKRNKILQLLWGKIYKNEITKCLVYKTLHQYLSQLDLMDDSTHLHEKKRNLFVSLF